MSGGEHDDRSAEAPSKNSRLVVALTRLPTWESSVAYKAGMDIDLFRPRRKSRAQQVAPRKALRRPPPPPHERSTDNMSRVSMLRVRP